MIRAVAQYFMALFALIGVVVVAGLVKNWRRPRYDATVPAGVRTRSPLSKAQRRRHRKRRR